MTTCVLVALAMIALDAATRPRERSPRVLDLSELIRKKNDKH